MNIPLTYYNQKGGLTDEEITNLMIQFPDIDLSTIISMGLEYDVILTLLGADNCGAPPPVDFEQEQRTRVEMCTRIISVLPPNKKLYDVPADGDCGFASILLKLVFDNYFGLNGNEFMQLYKSRAHAMMKIITNGNNFFNNGYMFSLGNFYQNFSREEFTELLGLIDNSSIYWQRDRILSYLPVAAEDIDLISKPDISDLNYLNTASKYCFQEDGTRCFPKNLISFLRNLLTVDNRDRESDQMSEFIDIIKFLKLFGYKIKFHTYNFYEHSNESYTFNLEDTRFDGDIFDNMTLMNIPFSAQINQDQEKLIELVYVRYQLDSCSGSHYMLIDDKKHVPIYEKLFPQLGTTEACQYAFNDFNYEDFCQKVKLLHLIQDCNK